jgi:NAD(P)-dependent dehydrogenase (short-subunit alcohol dehydrogenase family)
MSNRNQPERVLEGKVAIVTGGGRGLGRAHALALAEAGARVIVNDIGVERDGSGGTGAPADEVVAQIRENGGDAAASYESVADFAGAGRIVQAALDHFGRLDILVNNAGIFRHKLIHQMSEEEWDDVLNVHLKGTFSTARHAVPLFREQRSGRIINTASSQWRNPEGRANYGAAKGAIVSLTWALAFELAPFGATANAIAPMGATRSFNDPSHREMVAAAGLKRQKDPGEQGENRAGPEFVSPLVVYLASDRASDVNGVVFRVGSGKIGRYAHPTETRSLYRDWRREGVWPVEELEELIPGSLIPGGAARAPFIPTYDEPHP